MFDFSSEEKYIIEENIKSVEEIEKEARYRLYNSITALESNFNSSLYDYARGMVQGVKLFIGVMDAYRMTNIFCSGSTNDNQNET